MISFYLLCILGNYWVSYLISNQTKFCSELIAGCLLAACPLHLIDSFLLQMYFSDLLLTSGLNYKSKPCFWIVSNLINETKCAIKMSFDEQRYWFWNLLWWYLRLLLAEIFLAFLVACFSCTLLWFNVLLDFYIQTFPWQHGEETSSSSHCLKLSHLVTISFLTSVWAATEWEIRKPQQQSRVLERFRHTSVKVSGKNTAHQWPIQQMVLAHQWCADTFIT